MALNFADSLPSCVNKAPAVVRHGVEYLGSQLEFNLDSNITHVVETRIWIATVGFQESSTKKNAQLLLQVWDF